MWNLKQIGNVKIQLFSTYISRRRLINLPIKEMVEGQKVGENLITGNSCISLELLGIRRFQIYKLFKVEICSYRPFKWTFIMFTQVEKTVELSVLASRKLQCIYYQKTLTYV